MAGYVKRRDEGHVLRRMLDEPGPGKRDGEEDRNPCGNTREEDALDMTKRKNDIRYHSGDLIYDG